MLDHDDGYALGRLIQFALRVDVHPTTESEYRSLIDRYRTDQAFRQMAKAVLNGLGLQVFQTDTYGLTLVPTSDSVFAIKMADIRLNANADQRLISGLIHIAIMATVFPRPEDLDEDSSFARQPISVSEVDATLRQLCTSMDVAARNQPDMLDSIRKAGLYEAWHAYLGYRPASQNKSSTSSVYGMIKYAFELLEGQGCFIPAQRGDTDSFRPTHRYQQMVQEFAASYLAQTVRDLLTVPPSSQDA